MSHKEISILFSTGRHRYRRVLAQHPVMKFIFNVSLIIVQVTRYVVCFQNIQQP